MSIFSFINQSDRDQQDPENLVKTNPRQDLECLSEKTRNYPEYTSNHYRGRSGTNTDNHGRGFGRGMNRGREQACHPNRNRGSMHDVRRGIRMSDSTEVEEGQI